MKTIYYLGLLTLFFIHDAYASPVDDSKYRIQQAVLHLGQESGVKDLKVLAFDPKFSVHCLIDQLEVTEVSHIPGFQQKDSPYKKALHVVWCLRALRYLTSQNPTSWTDYEFQKYDKDRKDFLLREGSKKIPFFATWMSRDSVYLAPIDTQKRIIKKWNVWFKNANRPYVPNHDFDDWYF